MQQLITCEDNKIIFAFSNAWFQEDIKKLTENVLAPLSHYVIKEELVGADRESIRFSWQDKFYFILHFDCYSQSCWLESDDDISKDHIATLFKSFRQSTE